eukprot:12917744-Ditylum_brightwellii.AAC.1
MKIKDNWTTIEKVNPQTRNVETNPLHACSKKEGNVIHWIGCARIHGKNSFFVVDPWWVDP